MPWTISPSLSVAKPPLTPAWRSNSGSNPKTSSQADTRKGKSRSLFQAYYANLWKRLRSSQKSAQLWQNKTTNGTAWAARAVGVSAQGQVARPAYKRPCLALQEPAQPVWRGHGRRADHTSCFLPRMGMAHFSRSNKTDAKRNQNSIWSNFLWSKAGSFSQALADVLDSIHTAPLWQSDHHCQNCRQPKGGEKHKHNYFTWIHKENNLTHFCFSLFILTWTTLRSLKHRNSLSPLSQFVKNSNLDK